MGVGFALWRPRVNSWSDIVCLAMIVLGVSSYLRILWSSHDRGYLVVATSRGLSFENSGQELRHLLWNEIESVRRSWITGALIISGFNGTKLWEIPQQEFSNTAELHHCISEINRLRDSYLLA